MKIDLKINEKGISRDHFESEMKTAVVDQSIKDISEHIESVQCPKHG